MQDINVEQIMKEIRDEIKQKGMQELPLKFANISLVDCDLELPEKFEPDIVKKEILSLNALWNTIENTKVKTGNKLKLLIKKILNKGIMIIMRPIIIAQDIFNSSIVNTMNQFSCLIDENEKLKSDVEQLKNEIQLLKQKL